MCVEDPMATVSHLLMFPSCRLVSLMSLIDKKIIFQVTDVKHKEKLKYPPYPLSTVELQKRASRFFRMSSEHTMKVKIW